VSDGDGVHDRHGLAPFQKTVPVITTSKIAILRRTSSRRDKGFALAWGIPYCKRTWVIPRPKLAPLPPSLCAFLARYRGRNGRSPKQRSKTMAIMKTLARSSPAYKAIDDQGMARLSACMSAMLDEIEALDKQGLLDNGYAAMSEPAGFALDGTYSVKVTFSHYPTV